MFQPTTVLPICRYCDLPGLHGTTEECITALRGELDRELKLRGMKYVPKADQARTRADAPASGRAAWGGTAA